MRPLKLILATVIFPFIAHAQLPIIHTVAGNGEMGYGADFIKATTSNLSQHLGHIEIASNGELLICDSFRIRRVNSLNKKIYTLAGGNTPNDWGDGGPAGGALFKKPAGIVCAPNGDIYVSDNFSNKVRKIDKATGIITTIAGDGNEPYNGDNMLAVNAAVGAPHSLALDKAGNLYIASALGRIRKVDVNGIITTYAGTGVFGNSGDGGPATDATLGMGPITVDTAGNLYLATYFNTIRKVDGSTGIITTIMGAGNSQGDGGPAIEAMMESRAYDIEADRFGNIYFTEWEPSNRVRRIDANGIIMTVAGNGTYGYNGEQVEATQAHLSGPTAVTADSCGNIYITDYTHRVRMINLGVCKSPLGVDELTTTSATFSVYPNPASSELTIKSNGKISELAIIDVTGRSVLQRTVNSEQITVDVSRLVSGVYFIALRDGRGESKVVKFVRE